MPLSTRWLRIDNAVWEGAFYHDGEVEEDLSAQRKGLRAGIAEFERLARAVAEDFCDSPPIDPEKDWPLQVDLAHRWLEEICSASFVTLSEAGSLVLRRVQENVFSEWCLKATIQQNWHLHLTNTGL